MLNRLRQRNASGQGVVECAITQSNYSVTKWNKTCVDLGETKSIYDESTVQEFIKRRKLMDLRIEVSRSSEPRNAANFRPVRIASIIKGNAVYDGGFQCAFSVPGYFPMVSVKGPVASLASHTQQSAPYLPSITAVTFPSITMPRALWCLQQASNEASEAVHDFGVTLGELAETVSMLMSPLKGISSLCKASYLLGCELFFDKHPRKGKARKLLLRPDKAIKRFSAKTGMQKATGIAQSGCYVVDQASNFWLTWRFGVKPLIKEINDILSMDYREYESSELKFARKKVADEWTTRTGSSGGSLGNYLYFTLDDLVKWRQSSQATYAYSVKHGFGLSDFLNSTGLSLRHLPQVLWELVPCSFVLDRFVDVGSFIRALTPDPAVKTIDTCVSEKVEVILDRRVTNVYRLYRPQANYIAPINRRLRIWNFRYSRDVGIPVPILPLWNPKLLKIEQLVDHATLVWQRLPKWR